MQQGQLGFAKGLGAGFTGAPAADEFGHQLAGRFVVQFPVTRQHGLGGGDSEGTTQALRITSSVPASWLAFGVPSQTDFGEALVDLVEVENDHRSVGVSAGQQRWGKSEVRLGLTGLLAGKNVGPVWSR